jgi:hypothetical protein
MMRIVIADRLRLHAAGTALLVLVACLAPAVPAQALDCPVAQPLKRPGVLQETPAQIAAVGKQLAAGDASDRVPAIVADLRARYPTAENAELVNYILTAYCPVVAALPGLNESQKRAQVESFAAQLMQQIY